ncbi:MAG: M28 family peptidase [Gemmatimonadaceae bacterium]
MTFFRARILATAAAIASAVVGTSCDKFGHGPKTAFNADSAMAYVRTQLAFGPRVPGTIGHTRTGDWIVTQMRARADTVIEQRWQHVTAKGDTLPLRNVLARFRPAAAERVLYVTHWDTRPVAESDADPNKRGLPIPGANDGASGVALFVAIGDVLKKTPPNVGVDLLFVDGEDYGTFTPNVDVLLGSDYFAKHLPSPDYKPLYGVLWDMIADKEQSFPPEGNSVQRAPEVVTKVWNTAADLGYGDAFVKNGGQYITDDHVPLLDAGLRVIDVIDYWYPSESAQPHYHHTMQDTIDKLSARSFQTVGDVAVALVTGR